MALGGIYETGTVTIQPDRVSVTGVGTLWVPTVEIGDWLFIGGQVGLIGAIVDDTHLTLEAQWQGTLPAAAVYVIIKMSWLRYDPALTQSKVRQLLEELNQQGNFLFTSIDPPDPAMGEDGQWAIKTDASPWKLWYKVDGVWVQQAPPAGIRWRGAWSAAPTYEQADGVQHLGSSYISRTANTNQQPNLNADDWDLMAAKGDPGSTGAPGPPSIIWKGNWNSATPYQINDAVADLGSSYIAVAGNINSRPPNANWNYLAQSGGTLPDGTAGYHYTAKGPGNASTFEPFLAAGTGAVARTWQNKARDFVSVLDFGAVAGGTDCTAAINAAVAALSSGGTIYFPRGRWYVSAQILLTNAVNLRGESPSTTHIVTTHATANVLYAAVGNNRISDIGIIAGVARTAPPAGQGAAIYVDGSAFGVVIDNVFIDGLTATPGSGFQAAINQQSISSVRVYNTRIENIASGGIGIVLAGPGGGARIENCIISSGSGVPGFAAVLMAASWQTLIYGCDFLLCQNGLYINPGTGQNVTTLKSVSTFYDNCISAGVNMSPTGNGVICDLTFVDSWFSNTSSGKGLVVNGGGSTVINGVAIIGGQAYNNISDGIALTTGVVNFQVQGGLRASNNGGNGIVIGGTCSKITITGNEIGPTGVSLGNAGYGIALSGSLTDVLINNNNLTGNTLGAVSNTATGTNVILRDNFGVEGKGQLNITNSSTAESGIQVTNSNAAGNAVFAAVNDLGAGAGIANFGIRGSTIGAYGTLTPRDAFMYGNGATGVTIMADNATGAIKFASGGNVERMRLEADGRLKHSSASKAWLSVTVAGGVPTLAKSYNITSITDIAVGQLGVIIGTDFVGSYSLVGSVAPNNFGETLSIAGRSPGGFNLYCGSSSAGFVDPTAYDAAAFGDQ